MGTDFIRKAAACFEKSWDKGAIEASTANLFTQQISSVDRIAAAEIRNNARFTESDEVIVKLKGETLFAIRGLIEVARFIDPHPLLIEAVRDSCGIAKGTVEEVHNLAGVVEISLC